MRRRFTINGEGNLVDRDGNVLGRVVGITLDLPSEAASVGTIGVDVPLEEQQTVRTDDKPHSPSEPDDVATVWATYVEVMQPRRKELDPDERKIIREALKVATVEECQRAIRGCKESAFHMGQNDRRRKYNKPAQILKARRGHNETTRDRIEFFLDLAAKAGVESHVSSAPRAKVQQAKREVLAGWEFPHDEVVVRRGEEAARWLRAHGFGISYGADGRPSFLPPTVM